MAENIGNSSIAVGASLSPGSCKVDGSNSDMSYQEDENYADDMVSEDGDGSDYGDNDDYMYDEDDDNDYLSVQAQFDNVDLPPGVEASFSWLKDSAQTSSVTAHLSASPQAGSSGFLANEAKSASLLPGTMDSKSSFVASTSSIVTAELGCNGKEKVEDEDEVIKKYELFKSFDIVGDFSDHHYSNMGFQGQQPPKAWTKKIQDEWRILEKDLPETIYVRVYESRMDLLRAVILGPQGTPYHDGLFVFDVFFPTNYPDIPPMVYYYSGGLRLNPNLYDCGKVCLSLLNTWTGHGNEKWVPKKSTMLQVLVSIQALILNAKPFFNEPGFEKMSESEEGERKSKAYNEDAFVLSLKTMMYTLRRPPKHFEDFVVGHFRCRAHDILSACRAYMDGAAVGSLVKGRAPPNGVVQKNESLQFRTAVSRMMNGLISNFSRYGAKDCEQFRVP